MFPWHSSSAVKDEHLQKKKKSKNNECGMWKMAAARLSLNVPVERRSLSLRRANIKQIIIRESFGKPFGRLEGYYRDTG